MDKITEQQRNISAGREDSFILLHQLKEPILVLDRFCCITFCNPAMETLSGYASEEMCGQKSTLLLDNHNETERFESQILHKGGHAIDVQLSVSAISVNGVDHTALVLRDISSEKARQLDLENRMQYSKDVAESSPVGIITCDANGTINYLNSMVMKLLGSPSAEETKQINLFTFPLLVECGFSEKLKQSIQANAHINYELNYESKWGRKIWLNVHNKPFVSGGKQMAVIILDDLTERKKLEDRLISFSFTDALTGAYNRRYFKEKTEEEILNAKQLNRSFSLIMLDLDHFKSINDNFGHDAGDNVLKAVTALIMVKIRKTDTLVRWGGDEFVILLTDITNKQAADIAEKLQNNLRQTDIPPVGCVTASFGIASYQDGDSFKELIQKADEMLYGAKQDGRNCVKY